MEDTARASAAATDEADGYVDCLIPRGGRASFAVVENAKVPASKPAWALPHLCGSAGICKKRWTSYTTRKRAVRPCATPPRFAWFTGRCSKRSCPRSPRVWPVNRWSFGSAPRRGRHSGHARRPEDFDTEFLDYILAVKVVDSVQDAAAHIAAHSTGHSEAIVTEDAAAADAFCASRGFGRRICERLHALYGRRRIWAGL